MDPNRRRGTRSRWSRRIAVRRIVYAFQNDAGAERVVLRILGLNPDASYSVDALGLGRLGVARGASLIADGLELAALDDTAAHVLHLVRVVPGIDTAKR